MTRVLSGAAMLLLAVGVVGYAPPLAFLIAGEVLLLLGAFELGRLTEALRLGVPFWPSLAVAILACAMFSTTVVAVDLPLDGVLLVGLAAVGVFALSAWRGDLASMGTAAKTLLPAVYLGLPLGALVATRERYGVAALFLLMLTVIVSDTSQYYTGRLLGRRPLAPAISPKKTVEGAIGGVVFGTLFVAVAGAWWLPEMSRLLRVILGLAVVVLGICGDLFESLLKRRAGVKDSASWIPGHGGVLDRIDALLFAAPFYYVVLAYVGSADQ
ncbi:MAG: phosphatidate cytidylyltransferase [Vicinamibacterales bacterium]